MTKSTTAAAIAILIAALSAPLGAQWLNQPTRGLPRTADGKAMLAAPAPHMADGHPDFSGVWTKISPKYKSNIAADLKPAEMIKIVQTPSLIVILNPDLTYRQVYMDGRALEKTPNPSWMGYSVGHWDGNTLVVESFGFNDKTWLDHDGHPHTEALRMTERYTRRNLGNLDVEVTLADPGAYARPWTIKVRAELAPDTEMIEFVCNEANKNREHWVGKASDEAKNAIKVAPAILATYAGTYLEQPRLWSPTGVPRIVTITVSGDTLYGDMDGRGNASLLAKSETEFSGLYGLEVEFTKNGSGAPEQLFVKHVSGNYRFTRKK